MLKNKIPSIAVVGGGSWGTAIVKILNDAQQSNVVWWIRNPENASEITETGINRNYLSDVTLDVSRINIISDIQKATALADYIILAIPAAYLPKTMESTPLNLEEKFVFSAAKGIIPENLRTITEYVRKQLGVDQSNIGVLSGPCHAEEIGKEKIAYLTIAANQAKHINTMEKALQADYLKTVTSNDAVGIECAAIIKNIVAIAAGIASGLDYGDNFSAALIANAISEMNDFLQAVAPLKTRNINSSVYTGDLLVTTYSLHSRNRRFGTMLGQGLSVEEAQAKMKMVAEGYFAVKGIKKMALKYNIQAPIVNMVHTVIYENADPKIEMEKLVGKFK